MKSLVAKVAALLGVSEAQARLAVDAVFLAVSQSRRCGARGFGTFDRKPDGTLRFRAAKRKPDADK
jgi:nucleoid DNA-binding protein